MGLSPSAEPTELSRRRWQILILSSIGMFMGTMLTTIVAVALPRHLAPDLGLTYSEALWVQAIYPLTMSICFIPVGRLAQRAGLLRFYLVGMVVTGAFSIACGFAFNGPFLIASRCLQATGGAITAATSMALVTSVFPPQERGRGLGLNAMAGYVGMTVGPPLGRRHRQPCELALDLLHQPAPGGSRPGLGRVLLGRRAPGPCRLPRAYMVSAAGRASTWPAPPSWAWPWPVC